MLIVIPLLLLRFGRSHGGLETTAQAASRSRADAARARHAADPYQGIVLFTVEEKSKELPPVPIERDLLRTGTAKPLVIPVRWLVLVFSGARAWTGIASAFGAWRSGRGEHLLDGVGAVGDAGASNTGAAGGAAVEWRDAGDGEERGQSIGADRYGRAADGFDARRGSRRCIWGRSRSCRPSRIEFAFKTNPVSEEVRFAIPARGGDEEIR